MKRKLISACAALVLAAAAAAAGPANAAECASGKVTGLNYGGFDLSGHVPWLWVTINGTGYYIGMYDTSWKSFMRMTEMRAHLMAAMLGGMQVQILSGGDGTCAKMTDAGIEIDVWLPQPGS